MNLLQKSLYVSYAEFTLDLLTKWQKKKPDSAELKNLIKSINYIISYNNLLELERELYKDTYEKYEDVCLRRCLPTIKKRIKRYTRNMRKQRLTQQSRIANIERLLIAISMQVEKNTNTLKELTNENHETKDEPLHDNQ
jgi:hypothetical protein